MITDQPRYGLSFSFAQTKPGAQILRNFCAQYAVITTSSFGDVMQQCRDKENASANNLTHDRGGEWVVFLKIAFFYFCEQSDRPDRMFIHCVMMIHIELHLSHYPPEVWHKATEHR